jgi:hypothetical protein
MLRLLDWTNTRKDEGSTLLVLRILLQLLLLTLLLLLLLNLPLLLIIIPLLLLLPHRDKIPK